MVYLQEVVCSVVTLHLFPHFRCGVGKEFIFSNICDQDLMRE